MNTLPRQRARFENKLWLCKESYAKEDGVLIVKFTYQLLYYPPYCLHHHHTNFFCKKKEERNRILVPLLLALASTGEFQVTYTCT